LAHRCASKGLTVTILTKLLDRALMERAPKLREELQAKGELTPYLTGLANEVKDAMARSGTDKRTQALPYLEKVRAMNAAAAVAREIALAEAIDNLPFDKRPEA
jgi:hypothetical protein